MAMLIEDGIWKGYDKSDIIGGILTISQEVRGIDIAALHKSMFQHFGSGKRFRLQVEKQNAVYYSAGNCMVERGSGKVVFGTAYSEIPHDGSIKSIGIGALAWCDFGDRKVVVPGSVKNIEECAFYAAYNIQELYISSGVQNIFNFALSAKTKAICFSETVGQIGYCDLPDMVEIITVDKVNKSFYSENNCLIRKSDMAVLAMAGNTIKIPDGVKTIAPYACASGSIPTRLVIVPDSVEQIENDIMPNRLLTMMYGGKFSATNENKLAERGNFYFNGTGCDCVAIIKASKNSYAIRYAERHFIAHRYSESEI